MSILELFFGLFLICFLLGLLFLRAKNRKRLVFCIFLVLLFFGGSYIAIREDLDLSVSPSKEMTDNLVAKDHQLSHIILLSVDTLRRDAVSIYDFDNEHGSDHQTPELDRLLQDSVRFSNAVAPSPWTLSSFASAITGVAGQVHQAVSPEFFVPSEFDTLAERLYRDGYYTTAFVFNPFFAPEYQLDQGFIFYDPYPKNYYNSYLGKSFLSFFDSKNFFSSMTTAELTDRISQWTEKNYQDDFFLWVNYFDPHLPYAPPEEFYSRYLSKKGVKKGFDRHLEIQTGRYVPSLEERKNIKELYLAEVRYVDASIGRFIKRLKKLGIYDSSLIVFFSDHGEEFWEHHGFEHGHSTYGEVVEVPLGIKLPGNSYSGKVITQHVQLQSILPTILELAGVNYDSEMLSANSLVSLWEEGPKEFKAVPIVTTSLLYQEDRETVYFEDLKYTRYLISDREELFNLVEDPAEQVSILSNSPGEVSQGRKLLDGYNLQCRKLRETYQVDQNNTVDSENIPIEHLKSLGYIQ